jgi:hypothetical protein
MYLKLIGLQSLEAVHPLLKRVLEAGYLGNQISQTSQLGK